MKYQKGILATILILNIFSPIYGFSQGWEWQNPLPTGNRLYCMDFVDSLTGWLGSSAGTILHTTDGGNRWEIQYTGIEDFHCNSIDFINHQQGWATGNNGCSYILYTIDGGKYWTIQLIDSSHNFSHITFIDQKHGWVSRGWGDIYYTLDGGATWELGYTGQGYSEITSIVFLDTLHGWAEGQGMPLLYSEDGGRSWSADTTGIIGVKVFFSDFLHGWIGSWEGLLRTVDGGQTWLDDLPKFTEQYTLITDIFFVDTLAGWVTAWEEGIYRTVDGGWTWEQITTEMPYMLNGAYFFFTPRSGWIEFSRTWDGGKTVINQKEGFTLKYLWDVDFIDENTGWVVGYDGIIGKTSDGGKTWQSQESGNRDRFNSVYALEERRVWAVGLEGVITQTKDGGDSWESKYYTVGINTAHRAVTFIDSMRGWIAGDYIDEYSIKGFILHTEDGGKNWVEVLNSNVGIGDVTFVNKNKGWALGSGGIIYHSCDGGKKWTVQLTGGPDSEIIFLNENIGWASGVTPGRVWGTTDGGKTWTLLVDNLSGGLWGMDFINEKKGRIVGSMGYIWKTEDGGQTWQRQRSGTTNTLWAVDFVNEKEGWIVGDNGSILHTTTGGTTDVEMSYTSEYTVKNFHLFPNYPNPFNPKTVISYQLPEKGPVKLTIYDILGREVIMLVNELKPGGQHQVVWNGKDEEGGDVPSGIYFYHIQFRGGFQETGKMILIR